jgi:copper(I)-binding protein
MKTWLRIGLTIGLLAVMAAGCTPTEGGMLAVTEAWSRPAPAGGNGGVFFTIDNTTDAAERLLAAASEVAETVELHMSKTMGDTTSMKMQEFVDVPAGKTEFKPGGLHVMLINLSRDLKIGDTFEVTLTFEQAGKINIRVTVRE